jgi:hypothetical protein
MEVMGFLMMAHMAPIDVMIHNSRLMEPAHGLCVCRRFRRLMLP